MYRNLLVDQRREVAYPVNQRREAVVTEEEVNLIC